MFCVQCYSYLYDLFVYKDFYMFMVFFNNMEDVDICNDVLNLMSFFKVDKEKLKWWINSFFFILIVDNINDSEDLN